jgi:hypothetical protein
VESGRRGVLLVSGFFALGGLLHLGLAIFAGSQPEKFWGVWDAAGRGLFSVGVAWGLWRRLSLFRSVALVYCVLMLLTYLSALALAYARAPATFPTALVLESLYEIPSCALLLPYLLSGEATAVFSRSLL